MVFFRLFSISIISLALFFSTGCSGSSEDEISADEIIDDVEKAMGEEKSGDAASDNEAADLNAEFDETDENKPAPSSAYRPSFSDGGRYVVQVKVFASRRAAEGLASKLADEGYPSYVAEVSNPTPDLSGTFYRVRIGSFSGVSLAQEFGEKVLLAMGYQYWVDNKSNDNKGSDSYGGGYDASAPAVSEPAAPAASSSWETGGDWGAGTPAASEPAPEPAAEPAPEPAAEPAPAPAAEPAPASGADDWGTGTSEPSSGGGDFDF
jgi:cell division septation protein DedD